MRNALLCALLLSMVAFGGVSVTLQSSPNAVIYNGLSPAAYYTFTGKADVTAVQICLQPAAPGKPLPTVLLSSNGKAFPSLFVNQAGCALFAGNLFSVNGSRTVAVEVNADGLQVGRWWLLRIGSIQTTDGLVFPGLPVVQVIVGPSASQTKVSYTDTLNNLQPQGVARNLVQVPNTTGVVGRYLLTVNQGFGADFHGFTIKFTDPKLAMHLRQIRLQGGERLGEGAVFSPYLDYVAQDGSLKFTFPPARIFPGKYTFIVLADVDRDLNSFPAGVILATPEPTDFILTDVFGVRIIPTLALTGSTDPVASKKY